MVSGSGVASGGGWYPPVRGGAFGGAVRAGPEFAVGPEAGVLIIEGAADGPDPDMLGPVATGRPCRARQLFNAATRSSYGIMAPRYHAPVVLVDVGDPDPPLARAADRRLHPWFSRAPRRRVDGLAQLVEPRQAVGGRRGERRTEPQVARGARRLRSRRARRHPPRPRHERLPSRRAA